MRVSLLLGVIWAHIEVSPTSPSGSGRTGAGQVFGCDRCSPSLCFLFSRFSWNFSCQDRFPDPASYLSLQRTKQCSPPSLHMVGLDFPCQAPDKDTLLNYLGASLTLCIVFSARRRISQLSMDNLFGNAHYPEARALFSSDLSLNSGRLDCRKPSRPGTLKIVFGVPSGTFPSAGQMSQHKGLSD